MDKRQQNEKSNWLDRVRTNSWESEILIVGFVLIILLQTIDYFDVLRNNQYYLNSFWGGVPSVINSILVPIIIYVLFVSNYVLVISLSIYLILRGFWVAVIGLSSVFPKGIDVKKLNYSDYYKSNLKKYNIDDYSIIIDKICSSIFSISFLIIMFIISLSFFFSTIILLLLVFDKTQILNYDIPRTILGVLVTIYLFLGFIHFTDFILLGPLKKIKWNWFSRYYSIIVKFFSIITLTKFYEILFYTFISRLKKRYIFLFIISLLFLINVWGNWSFYNDYLFTEYVDTKKMFSFYKYEDKYEKHLQLSENKLATNYNIMVQSGIITDSFLELHIPYDPQLNYSIINECEGMKGEKISNDQILKCIDDISLILESSVFPKRSARFICL